MSEEAFHLQTALDNSGGDRDFFCELAGMFQEDAPEELRGLHDDLRAQNAERARFHAHTLKGMAGNIGGLTLCRVAREMEELLRGGNLPEAQEKLPHAEAALTELLDCLRAAVRNDGA